MPAEASAPPLSERLERVEQPPAPPAPSPRPATAAEWVALTLTLCAGVGLRLFFMTGPVGSDDTRYLDFADRFVSLRPFTDLDHAAGRLLFLILIGVPYKVGGNAYYATLANIGYSALTDLLVASFVYRTMGIRAALVAAAAMAFNALNVLYPGTILPDTTAGLFLTAATIALWSAQRTKEPRGHRSRVLLSGVLTCLAYMCKDPGILFVPVGAALLFLAPREPAWRERLLGPALFVGVFAAVFALDATVYRIFTGHFDYKALATAACHNSSIQPVGLGQLLRGGAGRLLSSFRITAMGGALLPLVIGVPALAAAGLLRRGWLVFSAAGLFVIFYSFFGTTGFSKLYPIPYQPRYLQPVVPLVAICLAALSARFVGAATSRPAWVAPLFLGAVLFAHDFRVMRDAAGTLYFAPAMKNLRTAVELLHADGLPVFVSPLLQQHSRHFLRPEDHRLLQIIPADGPLPAGYYVLSEHDDLAVRRDELTRLPVKLRVDLDWRELNRLRELRHRGTDQAVVVYEKAEPQR